jgi:hypothetical protein
MPPPTAHVARVLDGNEIGIISGALGSSVDMIAVAIGLVAINTDAPDNAIRVIYDLLDNEISEIAGVLGRTVDLMHVGNSVDRVVGGSGIVPSIASVPAITVPLTVVMLTGAHGDAAAQDHAAQGHGAAHGHSPRRRRQLRSRCHARSCRPW